MATVDRGYKIHDLGDDVKLSSEFRSPDDGACIDPGEVHVSVHSPDGEVVTHTYGVGAVVIKDDVGQYHCVVDANQSGEWHYRWWSTGEGKGAEERRFVVRHAVAVE